MADFLKECPLPSSVEELIRVLCEEQSQPSPGLNSRRVLASLGEDDSIKLLNYIRKTKITKSFDGFIVYLAKNYYNKTSNTSSKMPTKFDSYSIKEKNSIAASGSNAKTLRRDGSVMSFLSDKLSSMKLNVFSSSKVYKPTCEFVALEKLGFRRAFLVLSYIGRRKLEDVASVRDINNLVAESEKLTMGSFEKMVWDRYGDQYCLRKDRKKYRNWESSGPYYFYQCHVYLDGSYCFKGPFLSNRTNLLQKVFKEENVLIVKFAEEGKGKTKFSKGSGSSFAAIKKVAREGIHLGRKLYKFIAFKDGGKGQKDRITGSVKCYFVNTDMCPREVRSMFMHLDTLPSLSKYAARFELALSKTVTLPINLDALDITLEVINDIPCQLADGSVVKDKNGKALIHTDGTGFISADLVCGFSWNSCKANLMSDHNSERNDVHSFELNGLSSQFAELPLLMQFRLFYKGYAVKGTVLVNRKLPQRTIQVRPSMIKVLKDPERGHSLTVNSFEVVGMSGRPKKTCLTKYLIALLNYGGVPTEFFTNILKDAIHDARTSLTDKRAALQVALASGDMDDEFTIARMILSGIPLHEPYIQTRLSFLTNHQNKSLKEGKLPISESFYLMGTADPTDTLRSGEVCIIHENGQISGKVLVYRNPGIHFGDIHILTAKHIEGLEEIVGNSKYGIFFPTKGSRSLPDAMAGGDLDGDMYWISRNLDLLKYFKPSEPWTCMNQASSSDQKKPAEYSNEELEHELFSRCLGARFKPSLAMGIASISWLAHMDQLLSLGDNYAMEKECLKEKLLKLVDIYYDALDAPKTGVEVTVLRELVAVKYPHHMEKVSSSNYHSESVLGIIYDQVQEWEFENPSIPVWKLPILDVEVPNYNLKTWEYLYKNYRSEMSAALSMDDEELRTYTADKVVQNYKQILYEADDLGKSSRAWEEIYFDALAIYHVCYDYAKTKGAKKCGFAWKVAGEVLLKIITEGQAEKTLTCLPSVLEEVLSRKTS
ncbi:probable RNA-dependent RNA polymerase 3 [Chenopodium quinoa]|uniref:probable RNA-dependent RNA polymerase 3 n=1 Tax=Chenopodium quinoa TaxID=63459 RepID=UPI000B76CD81|nr:probable RNA-dependent RNA polymerase 3 [Chenopodium quinoa]